MLRALSEGKEACMSDTPLVEKLHCRFEQEFSNASAPQIGTHSHWPEETKATPSCNKARAYKFAICFGTKSRIRICQPTSLYVIHTLEEACWIRNAKERSKSHTCDVVSVLQILLPKRAHFELHEG